MKLDSQLVVVATELPEPMICRGYISELTVHGVADIPIEKHNKKRIIPVNAVIEPAFNPESSSLLR